MKSRVPIRGNFGESPLGRALHPKREVKGRRRRRAWWQSGPQEISTSNLSQPGFQQNQISTTYPLLPESGRSDSELKFGPFQAGSNGG